MLQVKALKLYYIHSTFNVAFRTLLESIVVLFPRSYAIMETYMVRFTKCNCTTRLVVVLATRRSWRVTYELITIETSVARCRKVRQDELIRTMTRYHVSPWAQHPLELFEYVSKAMTSNTKKIRPCHAGMLPHVACAGCIRDLLLNGAQPRRRLRTDILAYQRCSCLWGWWQGSYWLT